MASLDQISTTTQKAYIPVVVDNFFSSNPTFVFLVRKGKKLEGGATIVQPVVLNQNSTATSYSGADVLPVAFDEEITGAEFNWSQYAVSISITGLDDARNSGPYAVVNLVKSKIQIAEASLRQQVGADLQGDGTGNGGKNITGLAAAVDDGTNVGTYGNISRTTFTKWKANYSANGGVGRALTMALLNAQYENASKDNTRPNLILATHTCYTKYMSLLQPNVRYGDTKLADMGFPNLFFQGRPFVVDEQIQTTPTEIMWMLNTNFMDLYIHIKRNFFFVPFQTLANQDAVVAKILLMLQLVCSSPRMNTQIRDLNGSL